MEFVDGADAHRRGAGRAGHLVQRGAAEAVAVALHHRDQPVAVGIGRAVHMGQPGGAVDGEAHGHIAATVVPAARSGSATRHRPGEPPDSDLQSEFRVV